MTWSAPPTAVAGAALPYTWWNTYIRDNLLETAVGKATTAGYHFASTGVNSIAERAILQANVETQETTTSTTYVDLATPGPAVTITTGTKALVWMVCQISNSAANQSLASYALSGATTGGAVDTIAIWADQPSGGGLPRYGVTDLRSMTSGSNTFTMQYRVSAATGTFIRRRITVMAL